MTTKKRHARTPLAGRPATRLPRDLLVGRCLPMVRPTPPTPRLTGG